MMKRLRTILAFLIPFLPTFAFAQANCSGIFSAGYVCGSISGGFPSAVPLSSLGGVVGPNSSTVGHVTYWNNATGSLLADSGDITISGTTVSFPQTSNFTGTFEVGGNIMSFPAAPATLAGLAIAQTWSALQKHVNGDFALLGSSTGYTLLESGLSSTSNNTLMLPITASDTLAALGTVETWTAAQTFTNSDIKILGSSTGVTTLTSANASATNYTLTIPAATDTIAELGQANAFTGNNSFSGLSSWTGSLIVAGRSSGASTITVSATTDYFLCLDPTSNGITVNLPSTPTTWLTYLVKDCTGKSATHNITITPASGNIDGSSTFVMSTNYQSAAVTYTGSQWSIN